MPGLPLKLSAFGQDSKLFHVTSAIVQCRPKHKRFWGKTLQPRPESLFFLELQISLVQTLNPEAKARSLGSQGLDSPTPSSLASRVLGLKKIIPQVVENHVAEKRT